MTKASSVHPIEDEKEKKGSRHMQRSKRFPAARFLAAHRNKELPTVPTEFEGCRGAVPGKKVNEVVHSGTETQSSKKLWESLQLDAYHADAKK